MDTSTSQLPTETAYLIEGMARTCQLQGGMEFINNMSTLEDEGTDCFKTYEMLVDTVDVQIEQCEANEIAKRYLPGFNY